MSQALTDTYGNTREMEGTFEKLRKQAVRLQEDLPNIMQDLQPKHKDIVKAVKATGKVIGPQRVVVEVFAWSAVIVFASQIASFLSGYLLGPIVGLFFGKSGASWMAYFIIPVVLHVVIKNKERHYESDNQIRTMMLVTSLIQGTFAGYTISSISVSSQPLACLTPAIVSVAYTVSVRQARGNRFQTVGSSIGAAFLANLILGLMFVGMSLSYQVLTLGYVGVAGLVMQLVFHDAQSVCAT
ncbi:hypothetical protein OESDEN_23850 [Oesophagostomum dentatum]|uniref:Uncharacterized protein n=1 Tax=Oesophagostomum dentatum TaxID=61180 RepID=A0A0B1RZY1_OESDE|nr:hypothetical protein OESDEN_23850 [Oesophagostomum dentatum]